MRKETFYIPYPGNKSAFCKQFGMNAYWAGKHWSKRKQDAQQMHETVRACLLKSRIPKKVFERPARITFWHNDRMDIDNHAAIEKLIADAIKGWILQDDNRRFYVERVSRFWDENCIRVTVEEV